MFRQGVLDIWPNDVHRLNIWSREMIAVPLCEDGILHNLAQRTLMNVHIIEGREDGEEIE